MGIEIKQTSGPLVGAGLRLAEDVSSNTVLYVDRWSVSPPVLRFTINRTDPPGTVKGFLPGGATPAQIRYFGPTTSNSATTSSLSIGIDTTSNYFLTATDVKGPTGLGYQTPVPPSIMATIFVPLPSNDHPVLAGYAESATSTGGGPWSVEIDYYP